MAAFSSKLATSPISLVIILLTSSLTLFLDLHFSSIFAILLHATSPIAGLLNTTTCSLGRVPLYHSKPFFLDGNSTLNMRSGA